MKSSKRHVVIELHDAVEYLFSYGTLQLKSVQLGTFGRLLEGVPDQLPGYTLRPMEIRDDVAIRSRGKSHRPMLAATGRDEDLVDGTVFAMTTEELRRADSHEVSDYRRERIILMSGLGAWVYTDARQQVAEGSALRGHRET